MKYIEVEHPHGFLIWKGKQRAIASDKALPVDQELLLVCNNEAYAKVKLAQPAAVNLSEFERLEDEHAIRPEERKMLWSEARAFFVHRIKNIEQFSGSMPIVIEDGNAELVSQPELTPVELEIIRQAEKMPRQIILAEDGLVLDRKTLEVNHQPDYAKVFQIYEAAIGDKVIDGRLPLYRLALVRQPHLIQSTSYQLILLSGS